MMLPFGQVDDVAIEAGELRGGLADQDAGHERIVGHVAPDPELVGLDVLVADDQVLGRVEVDDRRQLLHLEPLGIAPANRLPVGNDTRGVERRGVDQGDRRHSQTSFPNGRNPAAPSQGRRCGSEASRTIPGGAGRGGLGWPDRSTSRYHALPTHRRQGGSPPARRKDNADMTIATKIRRPLGTMIVYGFPRADVEVDLAIAARLGAEVVEILPDWRAFPDPAPSATRVEDRGLAIHSAHGCWGGQSIRAERVDLGSTDPTDLGGEPRRPQALRRLARGGRGLVPGRPSRRALGPGGRRDAVARPWLGGSAILADHARGTGVTICVENMPPGVHPGSRMADLSRDRRGDSTGPRSPWPSTPAMPRSRPRRRPRPWRPAARLRTTHVHDNDGRQDTHLPPGLGLDRLGRAGSRRSTRSTIGGRSSWSASSISATSRRA